MKGIVTIYDENKEKVGEIPINKLNYREDMIVDKCIQDFNDFDPCIIHRTYAINSLSVELLKEVKNSCRDWEIYHIEDLGDRLKEYIDIEKEIVAGTCYVSFR